jgi:hypothetical protein
LVESLDKTKFSLVKVACDLGDALHGFQNYVSFKPSAIVNFLFRLGQRGILEYTESTQKYDRAEISKKPMGARNRVGIGL